MKCRHCQQRNSNRPRGLCWTCYYTPGVREQYSLIGKFAARGIADFNGRAASAHQPTRARPGSLEKVAVLELRASLRQGLWHPLDFPSRQDIA
jgi:hypothetical protein